MTHARLSGSIFNVSRSHRNLKENGTVQTVEVTAQISSRNDGTFKYHNHVLPPKTHANNKSLICPMEAICSRTTNFIKLDLFYAINSFDISLSRVAALEPLKSSTNDLPDSVDWHRFGSIGIEPKNLMSAIEQRASPPLLENILVHSEQCGHV